MEEEVKESRWILERERTHREQISERYEKASEEVVKYSAEVIEYKDKLRKT